VGILEVNKKEIMDFFLKIEVSKEGRTKEQEHA
jgi:hypothetical protein